MGKFSQILFTSDFDHTLSGMDNTVPQRNIDAIRRFIAEDGRFCMNSGRSLLLLRPKLSDVPVNAPCICYNGAACYDFAAERLDYAVPLPDDAPELLQKILALGEDFGVEIQCLDRHYSFRSSARDQFLQQQGLPLVRAETLPPLPWMKLVVCLAHDVDVLGGAAMPEQAARMAALQQQIAALGGSRYYAVRSLPLLMEIGPCGCDKGKAARRLADSLGRRMLVCAGDAPNDLQMLQAADMAFAPADAAPEVLALPEIQVTAPCGAGCIADAIERLEALIPQPR